MKSAKLIHFHSRKCIWISRLPNDANLYRPQCVKCHIPVLEQHDFRTQNELLHCSSQFKKWVYVFSNMTDLLVYELNKSRVAGPDNVMYYPMLLLLPLIHTNCLTNIARRVRTINIHNISVALCMRQAAKTPHGKFLSSPRNTAVWLPCSCRIRVSSEADIQWTKWCFNTVIICPLIHQVVTFNGPHKERFFNQFSSTPYLYNGLQHDYSWLC